MGATREVENLDSSADYMLLGLSTWIVIVIGFAYQFRSFQHLFYFSIFLILFNRLPG